MKYILLSLVFSISFSVSGVSGQASDLRKLIGSGNALAQNGRFADALAIYTEALNVTKDAAISDGLRAQVLYDIGVCHYQLKQTADAVAAFETAIERRPGYERALYALGRAEGGRQNWPKAEIAFIKALEINRENGEAWFDLAYVYLAKKDLGRAETAFEMAVRYKSVDAAVSHNNIGVILAVRGEIRRAETEFESAIRVSKGALAEAVSNLQICKKVCDSSYKLIAAKNFNFEISNLKLNLIERS